MRNTFLIKIIFQLANALISINAFSRYDVIILANSSTILNKFIEFDSSIVISTEKSCWPDRKLADKYPTVDLNGYRFINSGGLFEITC